MTEKVTLLIEGQEFRYWDELEITLSIDTFATCAFRAPFEPARAEFRDTFRPFSFKPLKILVNDRALFTGTMVGVVPEFDANSATVEVTGYALPAVLDDCTAPGDTVPHQFNKATLKTIAEALAGPFGLSVRFETEEGAKFGRVKLEEEQKILAFLAELGAQRNQIFTSDADGVLLCWRSVAVGNPVAVIVDEQPLTSVTATFNPQEYFSQLTGFGTKKRKSKGGRHTEKNPWLTSVLRPANFKLEDTDPADLETATRTRLGRMFANMASWAVGDLPTWRDPQGDLWTPNTTVQIEAPKAMIYRRSELLVRNVTLRQSKERESAALEVVLPGAFSGEVPTFLPWEAPIGSTF